MPRGNAPRKARRNAPSISRYRRFVRIFWRGMDAARQCATEGSLQRSIDQSLSAACADFLAR
jgi:hypothetical protein